MRPVRTVGLLGGGVIGAGWAARFAHAGLDVLVHDSDPNASGKIEAVMANAAIAFALRDGGEPKPGRVEIVDSIAALADGSDLVQESLPEREALKRQVLGELDAHLAPEVVIASSTSGLLPTRLQADLRHPERFCVGHPFNPVYLMPLVEVCGGGRTAPEIVDALVSFYGGIGMRPLTVRREIDGFIADRLMEALWREALWLLHDGIATVEEIDRAVRLGPGLRWAFMGPFMTYRLGGGEAGMRHFLKQFGPTLALPWSKLTDVPDLDDALIETIAAQSDAQAGGRSIDELERRRDRALVAILAALERTGGLGDAG